MRLSTITVFLLIVQSSLIFASDIDIDAQIEKIRTAPQSQRYQLVNELKQQIAQMNANQQARAIAKYQEETLNAQQTIETNPTSVDGSSIVNQANQQVIKNQIQQEQEHQIIIPPVENRDEHINNTIEKIIPEQKQQDPTIQESSPAETMQDNRPDFTDVKDTYRPTPEHESSVPDTSDRNPAKDISNDVKDQFPNHTPDMTNDVKEKIQQPVQDITDTVKQIIPDTSMKKEVQQPEITKEIPKRVNPINNQQQQESKPTYTKPSLPTSSPKRRF